jgi:hypothetical protein
MSVSLAGQGIPFILSFLEDAERFVERRCTLMRRVQSGWGHYDVCWDPVQRDLETHSCVVLALHEVGQLLCDRLQCGAT